MLKHWSFCPLGMPLLSSPPWNSLGNLTPSYSSVPMPWLSLPLSSWWIWSYSEYLTTCQIFILSSFLKFNVLIMFIRVSVCACECRYPKGQEEGIRFPRVGVTGCPIWVLGTKLNSSFRAVLALNHWANSPHLPSNLELHTVCTPGV